MSRHVRRCSRSRLTGSIARTDVPARCARLWTSSRISELAPKSGWGSSYLARRRLPARHPFRRGGIPVGEEPVLLIRGETEVGGLETAVVNEDRARGFVRRYVIAVSVVQHRVQARLGFLEDIVYRGGARNRGCLGRQFDADRRPARDRAVRA